MLSIKSQTEFQIGDVVVIDSVIGVVLNLSEAELATVYDLYEKDVEDYPIGYLSLANESDVVGFFKSFKTISELASSLKIKSFKELIDIIPYIEKKVIYATAQYFGKYPGSLFGIIGKKNV